MKVTQSGYTPHRDVTNNVHYYHPATFGTLHWDATTLADCVLMLVLMGYKSIGTMHMEQKIAFMVRTFMQVTAMIFKV